MLEFMKEWIEKSPKDFLKFAEIPHTLCRSPQRKYINIFQLMQIFYIETIGNAFNWNDSVILSNLGDICKICEKAGWLLSDSSKLILSLTLGIGWSVLPDQRYQRLLLENFIVILRQLVGLMEHIQLVSFSPCQRNLKNLGSISDCNDHKNGIDFYMRLVKWPQIAVKKKAK